MKKYIVLFLAFACITRIQAQNIEGQIVASQFGQYQVPGITTGSLQFSPDSCMVSGGGKNFAAFSVGVPVKIVDANPSLNEIDTPSAVFPQQCAISMSTSHIHTIPFYLTSGTGGLQEAIINGPVKRGGPNTIILNADWYTAIAPNSAAAVIGAAAGNASLGLVDVTTTPYTYYQWNGSQYVVITNGGGGGPPSGTASGGLSGTYPSPNVAGTLNVRNSGALCNWNGTSGTDDSVAFQAAATAAGNIYASSGTPVVVSVPYGCTLGTSGGNTTINVPAGVHWEGPGSIFVPAQSANPLFLTSSGSDISFDNLTITMVSNLTACGPTINNNACSAIFWSANSAGTGTAYKRVSVTNNTIVNSGWGITILAQLGLDTLSGVHVDGNTVIETQSPITSYQYADGIHVGGAVSGVTINHNIVSGRADAGIAVTSEMSSVLRQCSDVSITGNTLYEDRIGIDDSGCSSLTVSGNQVHADITTVSSNPAFRSIYYNALPTNVNVMGNNFENYQGSGTDVSAKYDCEGGCGNGTGTVNKSNSKFTGNKIFSMYVRGSGIDFSANTIEPSGTFDLDWDTTHGNGSAFDTIGQNSWQGTGTFSNDSRSDVYANDYLSPQVAGPGAITFTNPGEIAPISATYSSVIDTALGSSTSPVCPNGTGGALTTSGCSGGGGGGGGVSNANFVFVGDSITCGSFSTSGCQTSPVTTNSTGYSAVTTGTASSGATTMTVASSAGIVNGELVVGAGIAPGTTETISGTTVTLSQATTAALSTTAVSFGLMSYPAQAMRRAALTGNGNTGTNVGVSGWRTDQIIADYTTHVHPLAPSQTGKPGYLFVQMGTNDILQDIATATIQANLLSYWKTALADGWTVIAFTIPIGPWSGDQWNFWVQDNQFIRQNGTVWNRLVDETQVLSNNYDGTLWNTDHLHPINAGYSILAMLADLAIANTESVLPAMQVLPTGTGAGNYFLPVATGGLMTTGSNNTAFGNLAMQFATTDSNDAAFGQGSLNVANGGHDNTAMGHYTQSSTSTGTQNTSLGSFACNAVTTGSNNICIGYDADMSTGAATGRVQIGGGTNSTDNTLQFDSFNFLTSAGNATFANVNTGGLTAGQVTTPILTLQEPSDSAVNIYASTTTVPMSMTIPATLPTSTNGTWVCGVPVSGAYTCSWGPNGGGSLPTASTIGQVPTSTGSGTTYTAQTPLGGTTWYYPVEWYGAVGDATGATGVGTDNTTAIQACLTAVAAAGQGQCLLQAKKYRITSALTISASSVGLAGVSYGSFSTTQSNQLAAHVPVSAIVIDSATADAVDASGGAIGTPISFNKFNDFTIIRTVADTGAGTGCKNGLGTSVGAAGLSIQYAGGWVVDHVWSQDSACLYYYQNAGAYGTGAMTNSGGQWGANGFNPIVSVYGVLLNGANSAESYRLTNSFIQTLYPGYSGVQSIGFLAAGPKLNDIFLTNFETAFMTYGKFFLYQGSGTANSVSDIHLWHCVDDSFFQNGTVIDGLVSANGSQVEINGGWETTGAAGSSSNSAGVLILNSSGVTVSNMGFGQNGTQEFGVQSTGSSHISITGNRFLDQHLAAVALGTTSDATVTGNVFEGLSGNTSSMILGTSLTRSAFAGNTLGGFATTGVSLDSGSSNNAFSGVQAIDPANITTQVSNSGTNNSFDGVGNLIAKKTGAGTPATITFSSIPQTYQNLRLEGNFIITSGSNLAVIFNGDSTAAHYAYGLQYQASNTPGTLQSNSAAHAIIGAATGIVTMDIPSYANATAGGVNFNGLFSTMTIGSSTENGHFAGLWNGTDVTSITFEDVGGSALFTAPSTFSLYGLN